MHVKLCENNKFSTALINMITENHPNIKISSKKCLGKCHRCKHNPIALLNKKVLVGKDEEDLYNIIINKIVIP